jgi:hypothetical protein
MKNIAIILYAALASAAPAANDGQQKRGTEQPAVRIVDVARPEMSGIKSRSISGPHIGWSLPDPSIIFGDDYWRVYATSNGQQRVPVATTKDNARWDATNKDALPDPGSWVKESDRAVWAPDVVRNVSLAL